MEYRNFKMFTIYFCPICYDYKQTELNCTHDYKLYLFELSNGSLQLRRYCKLCHYRDSEIIKQKEYDISKIAIKKESSYQEFMSKNYDSESSERKLFISKLKENQEKIYYKKYYDYINSEEWQELRQKILKRDGYKCQICNKSANHVHHLTYVHFTKEYMFELVSLCEMCHIIEYHSQKAKDAVNGLILPNFKLNK